MAVLHPPPAVRRLRTFVYVDLRTWCLLLASSDQLARWDAFSPRRPARSHAPHDDGPVPVVVILVFDDRARAARRADERGDLACVCGASARRPSYARPAGGRTRRKARRGRVRRARAMAVVIRGTARRKVIGECDSLRPPLLRAARESERTRATDAAD